MLTVHHLNNSRSQRVLWLLEELDVPYEVKRYERDPQTMQAPASLRQVHPLGKSPVVTDGDVTVAESGAIIEYLLQTYDNGEFKPAQGTPEQRQFTYWLHYAEGSLMPPLLIRLVFEKVKTSPMPFFIRPIARQIADKTNQVFIAPQIRTHFNFVEQHLAKNTWFTGKAISGADIQMSFPLEASLARGLIGDQYPHIANFVKRCHERDAYQRALKRGGEYDYA